MTNIFRVVLLVTVMLIGSANSYGQVSLDEKDYSYLDEGDSTVNDDAKYIKMYGVTKTEYTRYTELMKGNNGFWYKDKPIAPIEILLINARSSQERSALADRLATIEDAKLEREMAGDHAHELAVNKLFGNKKMFDITRLENSRSIPAKKDVVYVVVDKSPITQTAKKIIDNQIMHTSYKVLHLYFDRSYKAKDIQIWARDQRIPVGLVQARSITLNEYDAMMIKKLVSGGSSVDNSYKYDGAKYVPVISL